METKDGEDEDEDEDDDDTRRITHKYFLNIQFRCLQEEERGKKS